MNTRSTPMQRFTALEWFAGPVLYAGLDQLSAVELAGTRAGTPLVRTLRLR